jgi:cytochrome c oxidase cbb3-type subunit 4
MYKEILRSIENIEIYPIISLLLFMGFFIGMFLWVIRVPKGYIDHMKSLPIEAQDPSTPSL